MPPSQLKQLKASLHESGVFGPQKNKKQRKVNKKDAQRQTQRNVALSGIRERFNPFEAKAPGRREKFEVVSNKLTKKAIERPGVTRGLGEERRRETLLKEMQSRNKVGGLLDRRFGEDDPDMTPEQKAAERYAQQALRVNKKNSMFNLEDDSDGELQLTHGGRALILGDDAARDDFDEDVSASEAEEFATQDDRPRKRARFQYDEDAVDEENQTPYRKKSKHEVMQEVMAKSKAYKVARQAAKEDDDELRMELDKGIGDLFNAMHGRIVPSKQLPSPPTTDSEPAIDPSRAAMLAGKSREDAEKEYEANLRHLKLEARSKPSVRTKSEEEKAAEEKARLEELEKQRLRRMKGEAESSDEDSSADGAEVEAEIDDAEAFGLEQPRPQPKYIPQLDVEDEDKFVMDNIVVTDSEVDAESDMEDDDFSSILDEPGDDGDDDFINGLVLPSATLVNTSASSNTFRTTQTLPFTFACPQTCEEIKEATRHLEMEDLPIVVQRIRALHHKGLAQENEQKLGNFAKSLVPWISDLVNRRCSQDPSMEIVEQLVRHLHSMAKAQPVEVAVGFRDYFRDLLQRENTSLHPGDLIILTSVSTTYPTSDQWHPVVTPAMSVLARYLGQTSADSFAELMKGIYACSLLVRFQARSERYAPEVVNFISKGLQLLVPGQLSQLPSLTTPSFTESGVFRITKPSKKPPTPKLKFEDLRSVCGMSHSKNPTKVNPESLFLVLVDLTAVCINLYSTKSAFPELTGPIQFVIAGLLSEKGILTCLSSTVISAVTRLFQSLTAVIEASTAERKPLFLHNHRPLAIKSSYPAFADDYNPERRYQDPDRERAELNKLKAEHKKERKGAMRELRKDANFMAREQLREKKAKDEAYEKKFKRLVAEIQGEEGREAKEYERERSKRKGRF